MIICSIEESKFGKMLIASESGKICYAAFVDDKQESFKGLKFYLIHQEWEMVSDNIHQDLVYRLTEQKVKDIFSLIQPIGTEFQKKVWHELIKIPFAETRSYLQIAIDIGSASSARAVGSAIGANPIAWLIPCHRVIQRSGDMGGYRWGIDRKKELLTWEKTMNHSNKKEYTQARLFQETNEKPKEI